MKAKLKQRQTGTVTLKMKHREAEKLMYVLAHNNVSWFDGELGSDVAREVYFVLEEAGVEQVD